MVMGMREKLIELVSDAELPMKSDERIIGYYALGFDEALHMADHLIANDVVPVVRCKDCTQWMYEYDDIGLCVTDVPDIDGVQRLACDFCSYGERKDNG